MSTIRRKDPKCLACGETTLRVKTRRIFHIYTGLKTDLDVIELHYPYPLKNIIKYDFYCTVPFICPHCNYVLIWADKALKIDKIKVKKLLATLSYKELFKKYSDSKKKSFNPFKIIYKIYQYSEIDIYKQHLMLLYSYYKDNSLKNFKQLIDEIEKDLTLYKNQLLKCYPIDLYRGEYYRRIGEFTQAKEIFEKIIKENREESYLKIANFQLKLIAQKDRECRTVE